MDLRLALRCRRCVKFYVVGVEYRILRRKRALQRLKFQAQNFGARQNLKNA
mgnify:CR=1 FL=1